MKHNLSEIPTEKEVNVILHGDDIEVVNDRPDVMDITPEDTLAMAAKFTPKTWAMAKQDEDFKSRLRIVFPDWDIVADNKENLSEYPIGYRHVVGLIVCTNKAINTGKIPFWRLPETYLHPRSEVNLANLMLSWREFFAAIKAKLDEEAAAAKRAEHPDPNYGGY